MNDQRAQLVELVLDRATSIFGAKVCQLCGDLRTFSGWAAAVGRHWTDDGSFLCGEHGGTDQQRDQLRGTNLRWCEICQRQVDRRVARRHGACYVCVICDHESVTRATLQAMSRRRYLEALHSRTLHEWVELLQCA